jgi:AraC-like DNA-binding protein
MNYYKPKSDKGKTFIHSIWIVRNGMQGIRNFELTIYPLGYPYITIKVGSPNKITFKNKKISYNQIFSAQTTYPTLFNFSLHEEAIFIRFKPWALYNLANKKSSFFTNNYWDISCINTDLNKKLNNIFLGNLDSEKKGLIIEKEIIQCIKQPKIDSRIIDTLEYIKAKNGVITIRELSDDIEISSRRLQQLFNIYIGISPKQTASIYRLHKIIYDIMKNIYPSSYLDFHYDQSHFIHDFKKLTNMSLNEFKNLIFTPEEINATLRLNLYATENDLLNI